MSEASIPRPKLTDEMVRAAALKVVPKIVGNDPDEMETCVESLARVYRWPMDGYELAKDLERYEGWDLERSDIDELDNMDHFVSTAQRQAEKEWFAANPVEPPLPVGTRIMQGVIAGIYEHQPAYYRVKETGCTNDSRFLLIKFEDARESA